MLNFSAFPVLETERLILREIVSADAKAVFAFRSDPIVQQYNSEPFTGVDQAADMIQWMTVIYERGDLIEWGITLKGGDNRVIGICGFSQWDRSNRRVSFGYELARDYWGQGLATEAGRAILRFGFEKMNVHRIYADSSRENVASIHVLEKLGFKQEGILRDHYYEDGRFHDEVLFGLLETDLRA